MFFSLKFQRDNQQNVSAVDSANGENRIKRLYFQRAVEMKQLHALAGPFLSAGGGWAVRGGLDA